MKFRLRFALCLAPCILAAQTNLAFHSGLAGWALPPESSAAGYSAEVRTEGCRTDACAVLLAPEEPAPGTMGNLQQTIDAVSYRKKRIRLRAWLRVEGTDSAARAQLWMRVECPGGRLGFFDTMADRPVTSRQWQLAEIRGEVDPEANAITLGILSRGKGRVWVDSATFEALPPAPGAVAARSTIQALYARVDAAYDTGDVDAIASLALADARIVVAGERMSLGEALGPIMDDIRKGMKFRSQSTVTSVQVDGNTATVFVNNLATRTQAAGAEAIASSNRDTWVRTAAGWRLKESSLIDTHRVETAQP